MIPKVRLLSVFTGNSFILSSEVGPRLNIEESNMQIDSPKMCFEMRSLKKVRSATNLHSSYLGLFWVLERKGKSLIHEL